MTQAVQTGSLSGQVVVKSDSQVSNQLLIPILMSGLIFLLTALVGVWAAPDRTAAFSRFSLFVLGSVLVGGIAWSAKGNVEVTVGIVSLFCGLLAAILTTHFMLTVNWDEVEFIRFPILGHIGLWIHNHSLQLSELPNLQKNITGGILVIALPLTLAGTVWAWSRRYISIVVISIVVLAINFFGLIMSNSRGAWLGFGFGTIYGAYFYWRFGRGNNSKLKWVGDILILASILSFIYMFWMVVTYPEYKEYFDQMMRESSPTRADLWQYSLLLVQDYWYTGSGLGNTAMVLSSYVFLLHVPFISHSHNLFLQIAVEQGIPGLIAFTVLIVFTIWGLSYAYQRGNHHVKLFCAFVIASLAGMLIHGTVEANLYAFQAMPVMFLPFAFTLALMLTTSDDREADASPVINQERLRHVAIWGGVTPNVIIVLMFLWPGSMSTLQANLGAVAQTRAELGVYSWPEWPIQDELRRTQTVDLSDALKHYEAALALNSNNVTALRRLGQIEISLGDYDIAKKHLEAAYLVAPNQRATRQMLGEIYAINGNVQRAVDLWNPLDLSQSQLDARRWWYYHIDANEQAELLEKAAVQLQATGH